MSASTFFPGAKRACLFLHQWKSILPIIGCGVGIALSQTEALSAEAGDLANDIRKNRMGTLRIEAPAGTEVQVKQLRHEFWFGAALANQAFSRGMTPEDSARYKEVFLSNFNAAVTENALKWHVMEPRQGRVDYSVVDAILDWTDRNNIPLRGHNIFWGIPNRVPGWQKSLDDRELKNVLKARALDVGQRYKGRFAEYDLNNEMMHADYYQERLGPGITHEMGLWVKEADPDAVLYLNDYDILTGNRLDDFVAHVKKLQSLHVPFSGLGVQGHLHGDTFDPSALRRALDRLAEFQLPIRITEFNFPGQRSQYYGRRGAKLSEEEEQAKAKAMADYLTICFAHPAVHGILLWGFWEGANWISVSSLYRRDWSPTPAAEIYRDLVFKQWWTNWKGRVDSTGHIEVQAFFGRHQVTIGDKTILTHLTGADGTKRISLENR